MRSRDTTTIGPTAYEGSFSGGEGACFGDRALQAGRHEPALTTTTARQYKIYKKMVKKMVKTKKK
jgi:hypothetical protein